MLELGNSQPQNSRICNFWIRNSWIPEFSLLSGVHCILSFLLSSLHNLIINAYGFQLFVLSFCSFLVLESANQKLSLSVGLFDDIGRKAQALQRLDFALQFILRGEGPDEIGKGSLLDFRSLQSFLLLEPLSLLLAFKGAYIQPVPNPLTEGTSVK